MVVNFKGADYQLFNDIIVKGVSKGDITTHPLIWEQ